MILIANMKYLTRKIGFYFFKYVKGFSSSPALLSVTKTNTWLCKFYLKPNYFCMLCFTLISNHFLMFQVPLNNKFVEQINLFISRLLLPSAFLLYLSPPFFSHLWKKACSKLSSALAYYYKPHCRHLRKLLPAATIVKSSTLISKAPICLRASN